MRLRHKKYGLIDENLTPNSSSERIAAMEAYATTNCNTSMFDEKE